eukprot:Sspe_Gene.76960::Locus_48063_Transcript_4_4_Confidence_0.571_Length_1250::g.76960::m.76960
MSSDVELWTVTDVASWLATLGGAAAAYQDVFRDQLIDGSTLLTLSEDDLKRDLGIAELGVRRTILRNITSLVGRRGWGSPHGRSSAASTASPPPSPRRPSPPPRVGAPPTSTFLNSISAISSTAASAISPQHQPSLVSLHPRRLPHDIPTTPQTPNVPTVHPQPAPVRAECISIIPASSPIEAETAPTTPPRKASSPRCNTGHTGPSVISWGRREAVPAVPVVCTPSVRYHTSTSSGADAPHQPSSTTSAIDYCAVEGRSTSPRLSPRPSSPITRIMRTPPMSSRISPPAKIVSRAGMPPQQRGAAVSLLIECCDCRHRAMLYPVAGSSFCNNCGEEREWCFVQTA